MNTRHSDWGQDPSGLCYCDDCVADDDAFIGIVADAIDRQLNTAKEFLAENDLNNAYRWVRVAYRTLDNYVGDDV